MGAAIDMELHDQVEKMCAIRHSGSINDITPLIELLIERKEFCEMFDDRNSPHIREIVKFKKFYDDKIKQILNI